MKKFFEEFKEFIAKGNAMSMAVGIIIGGAFTAIVNSIVTDILTPIIGIIMGGIDFSAMAITVGEASITFGNFLNAVINFIITAFVLFLIVRSFNRMAEAKEKLMKKQEEEAAEVAPAEPSNEEKLLTEIRDLLKEQK